MTIHASNEYDDLRECLELYVDTIESLPDGIIIFDESLKVIYANRVACVQFNYANKEFLGLGFNKLIPRNAYFPDADHVANYPK